MISLEVRGPNCSIVEVSAGKILFSYNTPVACYSNHTDKWYVRETLDGEKLSRTTTKHISANLPASEDKEYVCEGEFRAILSNY